MRIIDTVPYFIRNYDPSINFLRSYYSNYPEIFNEYFTYHCKNTEDRHIESLKKYPHYIESIKEVHQNILPILQEIKEEYFKLYQISFPIDVNLIVGGFGSNAYTHRQFIPNITFSLEQLSPIKNHLRVIVAHEFGHAAQNIISEEVRIDWTKIHWNSPLTWLNQEGAATHFSRRTVVNLNPSIYFSYNDDGDEWLEFSIRNKKEIKRAFQENYINLDDVIVFKKWFSINGLNRFGYSRLGYFVGDMFFQHQIEKYGELNAVTAWKEKDFEDNVKQWLFQN
ncbi:hypothetical protein WAX74_14685 [Psychrobacillus sp. FJAT-51614]|uniref:Aminopeptidase n=1 Tax=Psychrobacillus mangrovi TaxID=3117745 RepID=A0ABU8F780_9BACI